LTLPKPTTVKSGKDVVVTMKLKVPSNAAAGIRTGTILVTVSGVAGVDGTPGAGQLLRIPVFAAVALHDSDLALGNTPGPSAGIDTGRDVFAKSDTTWPSVVGQPGTGSNGDWLVQPVDLATSLTEAVFTAWDTAGLGNTYDLYLYDARLDLVATTHPFTSVGMTNQANDARGPSTVADPARLVLSAPASSRCSASAVRGWSVTSARAATWARRRSARRGSLGARPPRRRGRSESLGSFELPERSSGGVVVRPRGDRTTGATGEVLARRSPRPFRATVRYGRVDPAVHEIERAADRRSPRPARR
jgi:hypothetical protein